MLKRINSLPTLMALETHCFYPQHYSEQNIKHLFEHAECYSFYDPSKAINLGFMAVQQVGDNYELLRIGVLAAYQHQNIASQHLQAWLTTIKNHSCFIEVRIDNQNALKLYANCGFKTIHTRKQYYADGTDALVMRYTKAN